MMSETRKKKTGGLWVLLILAGISAALVLSARLTRPAVRPPAVPKPSASVVQLPKADAVSAAASDDGPSILADLADPVDVREVMRRLDALASERPASPQLVRAVREVHDYLGAAFDACLQPVRRAAESYALACDDKALFRDREKELRDSHRELLGLCLAVRMTSCALLRKSCWYAFANACFEQGRIDRGVEEGFRRDYAITRIEVKLDYAGQPDAWMRTDGFPVNFSRVSFEAAERRFGSRVLDGGEELLSFGACEALDEAGNGCWCPIWTGRYETQATPWQETAVQLLIRDENKVTTDIARRTIVLLEDPSLLAAAGGRVAGTVELHTDRNTGDPNPKVHFRLTVSGRGVDLLSLVPRDRTLTLE